MKLLLSVALILAALTAQAQTLEEQILALRRADTVGPVTAARLDIVVGALGSTQPRWIKLIGGGEMPDMALKSVPWFYHTGSGLKAPDLAEVKGEIQSSILYRDTREAPERNALRAFWTFQEMGGTPVAVRAPSLDSFVTSLFNPAATISESAFPQEINRLQAIMSERHKDLGNVRVWLHYELPASEYYAKMSDYSRPLVRAQAFIRTREVKQALGTLYESVEFVLVGLREFSLRITQFGMANYPSIDALADGSRLDMMCRGPIIGLPN